MNVTVSDHGRASPRTTALIAIAIYVLLLAILRLGPFEFPIPSIAGAWGGSRPGTFTETEAISATYLAAAAPALLLALLIANRHRLGMVFRIDKSRMIHAVVLALLTPIVVSVLVYLPFCAWALLGAGFWWAPILILDLFLVWHAIVGLLASGIRNRRLRVWAFVLTWWSFYGAAMLLSGIQPLE